MIFKYFNLFYVLIYLLLSGCGATYINDDNVTGYNLSKPDKIIVLPDTLREISGITAVSPSSFACIQDENGILYIYDVLKNMIQHQYVFNIDGDYEGIAKVNNSIYVLRSDGTLFEIDGYESPDFKLKSYSTGIPAKDNEGLCYDKDNNRLLIACKSKTEKGRENKDKRVIYGFDIKSGTLSQKPVLDFDILKIKQFAKKNKISLPSKTKKKGQIIEPVIKLRTSDICINPFTKKLFLISAVDHMLFIFNMKGEIEHIEKLNPLIFSKPEGITFFENGDMLISNEGGLNKPTLLRFNYLKNSL